MFYDTAFFDLDGTLTDSVPGIVNSVKYALEKGGYPTLTRAQLRSCVGPPLREQFMKLLNADEAESTRLLGLYREYFSVRGIYENSLYDGIYDMLERLCAEGLRMVLCTGKPEKFARIVLEHFKIDKFFCDVLGPTMDGKYDDKAQGLAVLLARSGGKKNVFIGDRCFDADAARANGIPCIGVLWGCGSREELKEHGVCMLAHTPNELEELLRRGPRGE